MGGSNGMTGETDLQGAVPSGASAAASGEVSPPHGGLHPAVEPDRPPTGRLFLQLGALVALLVLVLIGLWQYFKIDSAAEVYRKDLSRPSRELAEVLARDEGRLTGYELLDEKRGIYQIPVRRAMEMILKDPSLLAPSGPAAEARRPPAPAPPTEGGEDRK